MSSGHLLCPFSGSLHNSSYYTTKSPRCSSVLRKHSQKSQNRQGFPLYGLLPVQMLYCAPSSAVTTHEPILAQVIGLLQRIGHAAEQFPTFRTVGILDLLLPGFHGNRPITLLTRNKICNLHKMTPNTFCMAGFWPPCNILAQRCRFSHGFWARSAAARQCGDFQRTGLHLCCLKGSCGLTAPVCAAPARSDSSRRRRHPPESCNLGRCFPWGWRPNPG